jgi:lipoate-protein ligase A
MTETFVARHGGVSGVVSEGEFLAAERLVAEKFTTTEWLNRVP